MPEVIAGLSAIKERLYSSASDEVSPLLPFEIACQVYGNLSQSFLPIMCDLTQVRDCVIFATAAMDLVRYYGLIRRKPELKKLKKHFDLIGAGFFGIAGTFAIQQSKGSTLRDKFLARGITPATDQVAKDASRKVVELMLAMAAMSVFDHVEVEDPEVSNSKSPNPDLIVGHDGRRYGIACKSVSSFNEQTFLERIAEGVAQLERAVSAKTIDRNCGVVLLDISAMLDHDKLYKSKDGYPAMADSGRMLSCFVDDALEKVLGSAPRTMHEVIGHIYADRGLPPGVLIYAHGVMICHEDGRVIPIYQKALREACAGDTSSLKSFREKLNLAIHCRAGQR